MIMQSWSIQGIQFHIFFSKHWNQWKYSAVDGSWDTWRRSLIPQFTWRARRSLSWFGLSKKAPFQWIGAVWEGSIQESLKEVWQHAMALSFPMSYKPICKYYTQWWLSWLRMSGLTMASWRFTLVCPVTHRAGCPRHNVTCCSSSMLEKNLESSDPDDGVMA